MLFSSLIITAATCISGCADIGNGLTAEELKSKSEAILSEAAAVYDYSDYELSYEQGDSLMKQALLSYGEENGYFSSVEASFLRSQIQSEEGYFPYSDLDSMYVKEGALEEKTKLKTDLSVFKDVRKSDNPTVLNFNTSSSAVSGNASINTASLGSGMSFGRDDSGSGGGEPKINFPKKECKTENIAFYGSEMVNGHRFFGVLLTPDFCIDVYNNISSWFNRQKIYKASGIKGPAGMIYEIWENLVEYGPAVGFTAASVFAAQATKYVAELISPLLISLQNAQPIGIIIATVLLLVSVAVAFFFAMAFWLGYKGKGYAIGWEICGLLSWKWVNEGLS